MTAVRKNVIANIIGRGFSSFFTFVFVPLYFRFLGAEAYGLIGFFLTLQMVFLPLDIGTSYTIIREIAWLSAQEDKKQQMRDLCRTYEVIFWVVGFIIALLIATMSPLIARHWVNPEHLQVDTVSDAILLMGVMIGLYFPFLIYQGGLLGLQCQVSLNGLLVTTGLLRGLGAVLILIFVAPSIQAFFLWQVLMSTFQLIVGRFLLWRSLPIGHAGPQFNLFLLRPLWRFTASMAAIALATTVLTQIDKLVLSKMLPLEKFGYYSLASVVAGVPFLFGWPVSQAVYPRLTQVVALKNTSELTDLYHRSCQLLAVLLIPVGLVVAFFSKEVMLLWTGSAVIAQHTFSLARLIVIGSTFWGLIFIPSALQMAFAWSQLTLYAYASVTAVVLFVPLIIWSTAKYGAIGACFVWVLLNAGYLFGTIHWMHRQILPGEKWKWYRDDVGKPFLSALATVAIGRFLISGTLPRLMLVACLSGILVVTICVAAMSAPLIRSMSLSKLYSYGAHNKIKLRKSE